MSYRFPIQSMPQFDVTDLEHEASIEFMQELLNHTIREFEFHSYHNHGIVDTRRWKSQTHRDDIELYRERKVGVTGGTLFNSARHCRLDLPLFSSTVKTLASPTMLLTGYGHGRVENAMSAVVTESQHDLALAVKFKHHDVADCAILKTLEPPTESEPFHYLGFKFFARKSPTEGHLFKHRHSVYLEFSGITESSTGEQIGFHLMHSVELPMFPDLSDYNSIRALQSTRYIYRQKTNKTVEVFMLGNMDLSGHIFKPLANKFTVDVFFGVTRLLELAKVRRLSQMAYKQRCFGANTAVLGGTPACNVCTRTATKHKLLRCHLCGEDTCKKCTITKSVFVSDKSGILGDFVKVPACRACVRRANTGTLMPRVLRTPDSDLRFDLYRPKPSKTWSKPQGADQMLASERCRDTFPSDSTPILDFTHHKSSLPTTSKLCQQEKEENIIDPFLESSQRTKHITGEKSHFNQSSEHAEVYPIRLQPRSRVSILAPVDTDLYSTLPRKTRPSMDPQMSADMPSAERAVMNRLTELSKMAEDTFATARRNGIYCEQHWQKEFQMEIDANRSQVRRFVLISEIEVKSDVE
ncbi:unnamed protein product [Peronospora farinosa]|uniref:FYVE-type domain-containing protein n=1 Tax=Peronospora farinosa TaxID=134698 RepID=A0AAV0SVX4_9STRA|nr:unnamed protein product [Peronospora farinosa]CAI5709340.1 unnamed protein product [Peronospora farinosa]